MASKKIIDEMVQRSYRLRVANKNVIVKSAELERAKDEQRDALHDWNQIVDMGSNSEEREN